VGDDWVLTGMGKEQREYLFAPQVEGIVIQPFHGLKPKGCTTCGDPPYQGQERIVGASKEKDRYSGGQVRGEQIRGPQSRAILGDQCLESRTIVMVEMLAYCRGEGAMMMFQAGNPRLNALGKGRAIEAEIGGIGVSAANGQRSQPRRRLIGK